MIARNVFRRKGRTSMSVLAIAISMLLLLSMLSVAEGLWQAAVDDISKGREDILVTTGNFVGSTEILYGHELANILRADTENISEAAPFDAGFLIANSLNQAYESGTDRKSVV